MCLLAIFFRAVPDAPLVIGANREEFYDRGGEPPRVLPGKIPAVAGVDPTAGGTWLGLNARGVVVAVTNRAVTYLPAQPRSRGLLTRELLGCASAKEAVDQAVAELSTKRYAGCNLFCGDEERAVVIAAGDWLRVRPLPPGLHVLANRDINDGSDDRVLYALDYLGRRDYPDAGKCVSALEVLCSRADGENPPICLHGDDRGTVSSTILAVQQPIERSIYRHAQGAPDKAPYRDYSALLEFQGLPTGKWERG
jgi:Transport and Golgi organisation 2